VTFPGLPEARGSRWSWDPLVPLVGVVSLVTYALHGFHGALTRDLAVYSYAGQQVADGVPPYEGILNRAGPLAHAIPAVGVWIARLVGSDELITMRVCFALIATATVCFVYLLGRDVFGTRPAGLVCAATFLSFEGFVQYASNGPREKTPMVLFVVLALWAVTRRRWFAAGLFTSLATLCLQIAFFTAFPAAAAGALLLGTRWRVRELAMIALGGLVPVGLCLIWFALAGSVQASLDAFYFINNEYTVPNPLNAPERDLVRVREDLDMAYGVTLWLLYAGLVALALHALGVVSPRVRRWDPAVVLLAAFTVGAGFGVWWNIYQDYDAWPDLFPLLPLAAVGIAGVFALAARWLPRRVALLSAVALSLVGVGIALHFSLTHRDHTLDAQRRSVDQVLHVLPRGATITSIEAPQPLVLTDRTNPTRYQVFRSGLQDYLEDTWPGGRDGFVRDLLARRPTLISVGETVSHRWRREIAPDYVYVGSAPLFGWYARADLGEQKIAELRRVAGYDPDDKYARVEQEPG
jgi:4-amino-4-deoxy-L-arabinose transferase-like glycosyltransferase